MIVAAVTTMGIQLVGASPAAAFAERVRTSSNSAFDSALSKTATAKCPVGMVIVGGGGIVINGANQVMLTRLQPVHSTSGGDSYVASAAEIRQLPRFKFKPNTADLYQSYGGKWRVRAYAVCASSGVFTGYELKTSTSTGASEPFRRQSASCSPNNVTLGVGARVDVPAPGMVGLQMARAGRYLNGADVTAQEGPDGYAADWKLTAYAICALTPYGYNPQVVTTTSTGTTAKCDDFKVADNVLHTRVNGGSGGGSMWGSGRAYLWSLYPTHNLRAARADLTRPPSGEMLVQAICAY
ncbi:hypothetical protein [Nonomuraea rosea]